MNKFFDVHLKLQIGEIKKNTIKRVKAINQFEALLVAIKSEDGSDDMTAIEKRVAELSEDRNYRSWILGTDEMVGYLAEFIVELTEFEIKYDLDGETVSKIALLPKSAEIEYSDKYYFKQ